VKAIVAQKFFPGLLDIYLGKTGYDAQQYDGSADPNRPNNLWEPLPGDFGAHGDFDSRAHKRSWQVDLNLNRRWIGLGLAAAGAAILFVKIETNWKRSRTKFGNSWLHERSLRKTKLELDNRCF